MIKESELRACLASVEGYLLPLEKGVQDAIIDSAKKRGLIEREPTAREKWEMWKQRYMPYPSDTSSPSYGQSKIMTEGIVIAEEAIREAEGKK